MTERREERSERVQTKESGKSEGERRLKRKGESKVKRVGKQKESGQRESGERVERGRKMEGRKTVRMIGREIKNF